MTWIPSFFQLTHDFSPLPFHYRELCQVIKITPSISGEHIRLKLTNYFGSYPLVFEQILISRDPHFKRANLITQNDHQAVHIPAHHSIFTDACSYHIRSGEAVYILMKAHHPQTYADFACTYNPKYVNATLSRHYDFIPPLSQRWQNRKGWFCFESLEVDSSSTPLQFEVTGDSLVETGMVTGPLFTYFNQYYPNQIAWLNTGISGNQLLCDAPVEEPLYETFGRSLLTRQQSSHRHPQLLIAIIGSNDLIMPYYSKGIAEQNKSPRDFIQGMKNLLQMMNTRKCHLLSTTIAPIHLFDLPNPQPLELIIQRQRLQINQWLKQQSWTIDGSSLMAVGPEQQTLRPDYDFGDHLHWNPRGGQVFADLLIQYIEKQILR